MLDPVFKHFLRVASGFQRIEKEGDPNVNLTGPLSIDESA